MAMLLIVVLKQLTQLAKGAIAFVTLIGIIGCRPIVVSSIGQHGRTVQIGLHGRSRLSKPINVVSRILLATATTAIATLHVLNGVGSRAKALFSTNGTGYSPRTMDLHVHVQIVLTVKSTMAFAALVVCLVVVSTYTVIATRVAVTLAPLIVAVSVPVVVAAAVSAIAAHRER